MTAENKIALETALEEARHAVAHLEAATKAKSEDNAAFIRDHIECAGFRMKIALRKCGTVHHAEFSPIHASHRKREDQEGTVGSDAPEAYQTVAPAISLADSRHIMAREVVRDAS
jgi:hypothetical protein